MSEKTDMAGANGGNKPVYVLGRSEEERRRLTAQDALIGASTERLLVEAGIRPGMRVLDVGSGVGDVSLRAASLVGPEGEVVGVDRDPQAIADARDRVRALGLLNVSFVEGNALDVAFDGPFDAVVGRLVLLYQADPAALLRRVAEYVRPGGIFAFQDYTVADPVLSYPHSPLWHRTFDTIVETFQRAGIQMEMGLGLYRTFVEASIPAPNIVAERPIGGGPDYLGYRQVSDMMRSVLPAAERLGVTTAQEVDIETLEERLREEVVALGGVVTFPSTAGAWARKPTDQRD